MEYKCANVEMRKCEDENPANLLSSFFLLLIFTYSLFIFSRRQGFAKAAINNR